MTIKFTKQVALMADIFNDLTWVPASVLCTLLVFGAVPSVIREPRDEHTAIYTEFVDTTLE